jgi:hypothetical protein
LEYHCVISGAYAMKVLILLLLTPGILCAQSALDGTWLIDTDNAKLPDIAVEYRVAKGAFHCTGCIADVGIKADGRDRKISNSDYWDTASVRITSPQSVKIIVKKNGKTMFTETDTISADGATLTQALEDTTEAQTVTIETLSRRVRPGPPGSHALSGSWQVYKINRSKNGSIISYKCTTEGFSAETPLGEKYDAKFDGKEYPVEDDPGRTMVTVKRVGTSEVQITSKRSGKVVGILHLSVSADGETINAVFENKEGNTSSTFRMRKQH